MTITHPFHPLRGQCFSLLKVKRHADPSILMLRGTSRGTFAVPEEWTDHATPEPHPPSILQWTRLLEVVDFLQRLAGEKGVAE